MLHPLNCSTLFHWAGISTRCTFNSENVEFLHLLLACKQATSSGAICPLLLPGPSKMQPAPWLAAKHQSAPHTTAPQRHLFLGSGKLRSRVSRSMSFSGGKVCLDPAPWLVDCEDRCPQLSMCPSFSSKDHIRAWSMSSLWS